MINYCLNKHYWIVRVVIGILSVGVAGNMLAFAQTPPSTPTETDGITIHVVQRGETLSQIAQTYGITLEAILELNSQLAPDNIQAGQRIFIPNDRIGTQGILTRHIVQPGETLYSIAKTYYSTPQSLAEANNIFHTSSLYIGQDILVTAGANGLLPPETRSMHVVNAGETIFEIALRYGIPIAELATANQIDITTPLQVGQVLVLPNVTFGESAVSFPPPIIDFALGPIPVQQGLTMAARLVTSEPVTITGTFLDRPIDFSMDGNMSRAFIGVHSFTNPGIYPLQLTLTTASGQTTDYNIRLRVTGGEYGQEDIVIPPERENLLEPSIIENELNLIATTMTGFSPEKYLSGLMSLPSVGPISSQYGTRRSYNGSAYDTFHGGADFAGAPGTIVTAPASGVVVLAEPLNVRGNTVIIDHGWGVYTGYWHNTDIFVVAGQTVQRGDAISTIGSTGLVTGAHLHWEMWVGGVQVDPLQWLSVDFDAIGAPTANTAEATP